MNDVTVTPRDSLAGIAATSAATAAAETSLVAGKEKTRQVPHKAGDPVAVPDRTKPSLDPGGTKADLSGLECILFEKPVEQSLPDEPGDELSIGNVIRLLIQLGQANWQASMDSRQAELKAQIGSIQSQAEKMRNASVLGMVMGVVFGAVGIVGGIVNVVGSIKSFRSQGKLDSGSGLKEQQSSLKQYKNDLGKMTDKVASNRNKAADTLDPAKMEKYWAKASAYEAKVADAQKGVSEGESALGQLQAGFERQSKLLDKSASKWSSASGALGSLGKTGESAGQSGAQLMQADTKLEEATQAKHQAKMQESSDYVQHYNNMIRDLRSLFAQINQDINQTVRSVVNKA